MEFLARHGPLRQLDHYGGHLNFFQYYLIDVIAALIFSVVVIVGVVLFTIVKLLRCIRRVLRGKAKHE